MLLGSLMKEIHKLGNLTPSATRIYHGYSVADLMKRRSDFQLPKWYGVSDLPRQGKQRIPYVCNIAERIQPMLDEIEKSISGFKLVEF